MDPVDILVDVLRYSVPAAIVVIMAVVVFRHLVKIEYRRQSGELRLHAFQQILPLRIAASERAALYLERINPANSIARHNATPGLSARQLHEILLAEMNQEYEHNVVQQIYLSEAAWTLLNKAKLDITGILHRVLARMSPQSTALDYSEALYAEMGQLEENPVNPALQALRYDLLRMSK
ncbi:MAG: hypothetical protein KF690_03020 [Bacteroidetes bacterium]|nr:hypothetical protein [Bacteroidota bacterium]